MSFSVHSLLAIAFLSLAACASVNSAEPREKLTGGAEPELPDAADQVASERTRRFTVDDLLKIERIGSVRFSADGDTLVYEHFGARADGTDFGRGINSGSNSRLYSVDLTRFSAPQTLFAQAPGESYWIDGMLPDDRGVIYNVLSKDAGFRKGIAKFGQRHSKILDVNSDHYAFLASPWISNKIVTPLLGEDHVPMITGLRAEMREDVIASWRAQRRGKQPTASVIGSGKYESFKGRGGQLSLVDPTSDEVTMLAPGEFWIRVVSPDGQSLAALRRDRVKLDSSQAMDNGANSRGIKNTLLLFEFETSSEHSVIEPCRRCDVLSSSIRWSKDGRFLSFVAREEGEPWDAATYRIYDRENRNTQNVDLGGYKTFSTRGNASLEFPSIWLDDSLVVRAIPPTRSDTGATSDVRSDWFVIANGVPKNLTRDFQGNIPQVIASTSGKLIMIHDGNVWAVSNEGDKQDLTTQIDSAVTHWNGQSRRDYFDPYQDILVLETITESEFKQKAVLFLELENGTIERLNVGRETARIVAVSPKHRKIATLENDRGVSRLAVVDASETVREVLEINSHLDEISPAIPVRMDHLGPSGDKRISWVVMPPGWSPGDPPVPAIVDVYPGYALGRNFASQIVDLDVSASQQILPANGYAVLYPSFPAPRDEVPRVPIDRIVDEVFVAVDRAIEEGLIDSERLAVTGYSFGGYAAAGLVGFTDRFKAAVAQSGKYNLTSAYGVFDVRVRFLNEYYGPDYSGAGWSESGQGSLGPPVWRDPDLYWRNSPLAHVENISTPILITHGDYDYLSITQAEEFFTGLARLNKDAVFVRYWGEGHSISSPANIRDMWERILNWYDQHLN